MIRFKVKRWVGLSALTILLLVACPMTVFASPDATVSVPDASANPDGTVTVPISITDVTSMGAVDIDLHYDNSVVEVTNVTEGGELGGFLASGIHNDLGFTSIVWFTGYLEGETGNFVCAYVTLHAVGDPAETSDFTLDVIDLIDPEANSIPHTVDNGLFSIKALMEGDVTMNDHVNISDAIFIVQHLVGIKTLDADQLEAADTTDDGKVTISDAMHIALWLVDPDGSLGVLFKSLWESPADDHMLQPLP